MRSMGRGDFRSVLRSNAGALDHEKEAVKPGAIFLLVIFGALPGHARSCSGKVIEDMTVTEAPCMASDLVHHPESYPALCGDDPTAVHCTSLVPRFPSLTLPFGGPGGFIEVLEGMESFPVSIEKGDSRVWILQEIEQGMALMKDVPDYYGIPIVKPFAHLRSDAVFPGEGSRMSLYFCVSDIREECIVDSVVALSWIVKHDAKIFSDDFEAAGQVFALRGNCPESIRIGDAWKTWGELYLPEG
jgi:hypothetical protein